MKTASLMQRFPFSRVAVLCFLLVLVATAAVPGYLTRYWPWTQPLPLTNIKQLNSLGKTGVMLPGWQIKQQQLQLIGGHKWFEQEFQQDGQKPVILLLLPQKSNKDQPEVEWMDINGSQEWLLLQNSAQEINRSKVWETDSERRLNFTVDASQVKGQLATLPTAKVEARFFRAWNQRQTFAVLQWYATPDGGNPDPSHWFFADQLAQWRRRRIPWVAVSLHIPIQPLGDIETTRTLAESLGKTVEAALIPILNY